MRAAHARRGSVYVAVMGTALLISLIGFTSLHLSRLELKAATSENENAYARQLAQSGVEYAVAAIESDLLWRTLYFHGVEYSRNPLGVTENIYFRLLDNVDNNLANDNTQDVEIQGIGRYGNSEFRYSVTYSPSLTAAQQDSGTIKKYDTTWNASETLSTGAFLGQHFLANLPAGTVSWNVTYIDIYLQSAGSTGSTLSINFYHSDASGKPGTLIESITVADSSLPGGAPDWYRVSFSNATGLTPGQGYSFTVNHASGGFAANIPYQNPLTQTDTHMLRGGPGWCNTAPTESLMFRVHGTYTTSMATGPFTISPGSWHRVAVP